MKWCDCKKQKTTKFVVRPSWDQYFINLIPLIALRSPCLRRHVGCVITKDNRIVATGYNGPPSGLNHCKTCNREKEASGTKHEICRAVHAEMNAILYTRNREDLKGATVYCNYTPCSSCAKMVISVGIARWVALESYPDSFTTELFNEAGINLEIVNK